MGIIPDQTEISEPTALAALVCVLLIASNRLKGKTKSSQKLFYHIQTVSGEATCKDIGHNATTHAGEKSIKAWMINLISSGCNLYSYIGNISAASDGIIYLIQ